MATWHAKPIGGYSRTSTEGLENATLLCLSLVAQGWTISSVSALLGNGAGESGLNPWRWESDDIPSVAEFNSWSSEEAQNHGYGMFQFTPANKYINSTNATLYAEWYGPNFSDRPGKVSDGESQTRFFVDGVSNSWSHGLYDYYYDDFLAIGVNIDTFYNLTFDEFKNARTVSGTIVPLADLVGAFELCYERPADWAAASSYAGRVENAQYWYKYFTNNPPEPPGPTPTTRKKMPLWMLLHYY